jgi:colanic acid/amylovoran biosynthesis protein
MEEPIILVSQHYSRNKGNVMLLYSLVETLKEQVPGARIVVSSFEPEETAKLFGYECCEWPFRTRRLKESRGLTRMQRALSEMAHLLAQVGLALLLRWRIFNPSSLGRPFHPLHMLHQSDLIISPGGHLFTNFNPFIGVCAHWFPYLLAVLMGKRYAILGQTLGPFFGAFRRPTIWMTRFLVKHAALVSVRDSCSLSTLQDCGIDTAAILKTSELVFLLPDHGVSNASPDPFPGRDPVVGFTFHHLYYKRWMNKEQYICRMAAFIKRIHERFGFHFRFISMESSIQDRGDAPLLREIIARLPVSVRVDISDTGMDPRELIPVFAGLDFLCATKTHSVVLGLRKRIPTLAVAYDTKTSDFMAEFHQQEFCVSLENFDPDAAFERFERLVQAACSVRSVLHQKLAFVQEQARENFYAVKRLMASPC